MIFFHNLLQGFNGSSCEQEDPEEACWFSPNCSGHGKCKSGFCHCDQGYWGLGCGRSRAYALLPGSQAIPSATKLRIYMYDLPSHVTFPGNARLPPLPPWVYPTPKNSL